MEILREYQNIVEKIKTEQKIELNELKVLLQEGQKEEVSYLYHQARKTADTVYGKRIFKRGLIEFTNYCKNDCYYCGIRRSNLSIERYRLSKEMILDCCKRGYELRP